MKRRLSASVRMLRAAVAIVCAVSALSCVCTLRASEWGTDSSGLFSDPMNWIGGVPGVSDSATFDRGNVTYAVSFDADATVGSTNITTSEITFQSSGGPHSFFAGGISIGNSGGATLNTQLSNLSGTSLWIGSGVGSNGTLNVLAGSVNIIGGNNVNFVIGDFEGSGTLNIQNGAVVNRDGFAILGYRNGHGVVNVHGLGSTWNNAGEIDIGSSGEGTMSITGGGIVSSARGFISSNSSATVDGLGSQWLNTQSLYVNFGGSLSIVNQAQLDAGEELDNRGSFSGDGAVFADSFRNGGVVHLKPSASGLTVHGSYVDGGVLNAELASSALYGKLTVTGSADIHGTLQFSLLNNFAPQAGDSFDVLDATFHGGFTALDLPTLSGGLKWDVSQLNTDGVVSVNVNAADTWKAAVDGDWSDDSKWLDSSAPGVSDSVLLAVGNQQRDYSITFSTAPPAIQDFAMTAGFVTFKSTGGAKTLNLTAPGGNQNATISGTETRLILNGNPETAVHLNVGNDLIVKAGGTLNAAGEITVGGNVLIDGGIFSALGDRFHLENGRSITIQNGGFIQLDGFAAPLNSAVTVTGHNSSWNGGISIDNGSQMSVLSGAQSFGPVDIGTAGNGEFLVDGESSFANGSLNRWGAGGNSATATFSNGGKAVYSLVFVADEVPGSSAQVNILSGGSLHIIQLLAGTQASGNPTANFEVQGANSQLSVANATFGNSSAGTVTVNVGTSTGGARLISSDGVVNVLKTATINIGGALSQGDFLAGGNVLIDGGLLRIAAGSTFELATGKQLTIQNGGRAEFAGNYAASTSGVYNLIGPSSELQVSGTLTIQDNTKVNLLDGNSLSLPGGLVVANGGQVNLPAGTSLDVTGNSTTLNPAGSINITGGSANLGTLHANGGTIQLTAGSVAFLGNLNTGANQPFGPNPTIAANQYVTLDGTTTVNPLNVLTLAGGSLTTGALVNSGTFAFNGGTLRITGAQGLTIGAGGPLGSVFTLGAGRTLNPVVKTDVQAAAYFEIDGGASFTTGTLNNAGETNLTSSAATLNATTVHNTGLLRGDGRVIAAMNNLAGGEIRAEAGKTLKFIGGSVNAGRINLQGGTVEFSQTLVNGAGAITGHGTISAGGAGLTNSGQINLAGGYSEVFGNVTNQAASLGGLRILSNSDVTFWNDVTNHVGAVFNVSAGSSATFLGDYHGSGISGPGSIEFHSTLSPGFSAEEMNMGGNVTLGSTSVLEMELGGTAPGSQYDQMFVAGTMHLDGVLHVSLIDGFTPLINNSFTLIIAGNIDGSFSAIELPALPAPLEWKTTMIDQYAYIQVIGRPPIPGDFDGDYDVDGADFVVWQTNFPTASGASYSTGDADGDGDVDGADFVWWQTNFPRTPNGADVLLPEPAGVWLAIASLGCFVCVRRAREGHDFRPAAKPVAVAGHAHPDLTKVDH